MAEEDEGGPSTSAPPLFPIFPGLQGVVAGTGAETGPQISFPSFSSTPPAAVRSSLFPISGTEGETATTLQHAAPAWLQNASFSESLLPARAPPVLEEEKGGEEAKAVEPPAAGSLDQPSSEGNSDDSAEDRRRRRRRKRRKRKQEEERKSKRHESQSSFVDEKAIGSLAGSAVKRKAAVTSWADGKTPQREYFFDVQGDRDNLAFGSLYRLDVAQFRRHWTDESGDGLFLFGAGKKRKVDLEEDQDELPNSGSQDRYFFPKIVSLERQGNLKRLRIYTHSASSKGSKVSTSFGESAYVPLKVDEDQKLRSEIQESWEDSINRKTREFNQLTREKGHDESVWVAFAQFQDEVIQSSHKKAVIQQAVDKKISVLEKALEEHPDSEDLLLLYLQTCKQRLDASVLVTKWEQVVRRHPGSARIWKEYIRFQRAQFSQFSVSAMRKVYLQALDALVVNRNQMRSKGPNNQELIDSELLLVSMFFDYARFEWQSGHHELAIGMLQAQIEYSLFFPPIQLSESSKKRLFEAFWDSGAARIGEEGALGWALWLEKEEEQLQRAKMTHVDDQSEKEAEVGGWTGWADPVAEAGVSRDSLDKPVDTVEDDLEDMQVDEDPEEDEAALLEKLGLSIDIDKEVQVDDPGVWQSWAEEEARRDCHQWAPVRKVAENGQRMDEADTEDENLERMVLFEDIREILFSLETEQGRFGLVGQSVDLCEGPLRQWCCSNSCLFKGRWDALEGLSSSSLSEILDWDRNGDLPDDHVLLERLVGGKDWYQQSEGRSDFVRNLIELVRPVFCHHKGLLEAVLKTERIVAGVKGHDVQQSENAARSLAKRLLKSNRQDHLLLGAYGCLEASFGNVEVARKVFDTTLTSLSALSLEAKLDAPILYLAYADVEWTQLEAEEGPESVPVDGSQRLLRVLCFAGAGGTFSPVGGSSAVSSSLLLRAQKGFAEQMQRVRQSCHGADLTERGAAIISCAAMFELVRSGWKAAASVFEEGLAMTLPVRRQRSLECEMLMERFIRMVEDKRQHVKPTHVRKVVLRGLVQYPLNPRILQAYVRQSGLISNLRRVFDDEMSRSPSTLLGLAALSCELGRPSSAHRIHSLLERALEHSSTEQSVVLWRLYLAYELEVATNTDGARRIFFRAIHACPWSKVLWMDGFLKLKSALSAKEQSEFLDIMRDKELRIRTDIYEILLQQAE